MPSVEATVIARLLIDEIISRHGAPRVLLSDRGTNFLSKVVAEVCKIFQIQKVNTSSYHPQTDGLVERFNSTLCQSLSMYVSKNQKDWDEFIPLVLFAHRTSVLDAIGDSPFYVLYGREPRLPIDVKYLPPAADDLSTSVLDYRKRVVEKVELAQNLARENLQRAQQKMKDYYDQKTKEPVFEVGQRVWVYTPRTRKGLSKKLMHNWLGPYRIVEKLSPVHFKLRTIANKKIVFSCHANRRKPYVDPILRPIDSPPFDDPAEPYLDESDIPKDCFDPNNSVHAEENPLHIGLNPVGKQALVTQQSHEEKESNKESDQEKTKNQLQNKKEPTPEAIVIDDKAMFSAEIILKHRTRNGKVEYLVEWLNYLKAGQRGKRKKTFWINVSLIIISGHQTNLSLQFVVVYLAAGFEFCVFTYTFIHFSQICFYRWIHERPLFV